MRCVEQHNAVYAFLVRIMKKITVIFALAFAFTTGMAAVTVIVAVA